jgi:nucleoside-diphosphate-sugar epimerase
LQTQIFAGPMSGGGSVHAEICFIEQRPTGPAALDVEVSEAGQVEPPRRVLVTNPTSGTGRAVVEALTTHYQVVGLVCAYGMEQIEERKRQALAMGIDPANLVGFDWASCTLDCPRFPSVWAMVHPAVKYRFPGCAPGTDPGGKHEMLMDILLQAWRAANGPFVLFSTSDVYGLPPPPLPIRPDSPQALRGFAADDTSYPAYKHRCELRLEAVATELGREDHISILRLPFIVKGRRECIALLRTKLPLLEGAADDRHQRGDGFISCVDASAIAARCLDTPARGACNVVTEHFVYRDDVFRSPANFAQALSQATTKSRSLLCYHWSYDTTFVAEQLQYNPRDRLADLIDRLSQPAA